MNNRGFVATSIMYSFFIVFALLSLSILGTYAHYRTLNINLNKTIKDELKDKINLHSGSHTITFDYNGGSGVEPSRLVDENDLYGELPDAIYSGYDFKGWYTEALGGDRVSSSTVMESNDVTLFAHWKIHYSNLSQISKMQEMNSSICSNASAGTSKTLTDVRDSNTYRVTKLADGNCWMTENLKLINKTIDADNSNTSSSFTIPSASSSSWSGYTDNRACYHSSYGAYYSYFTVTGGTVDDNVSTGTTDYDICPTGWRLPTSQEIVRLLTAYSVSNDSSGFTKLRSSPLYFDISASCPYSTSNVDTSGWNASFWTADIRSSSDANNFSYWSIGYGPIYNTDKRNANAVRCIAK